MKVDIIPAATINSTKEGQISIGNMSHTTGIIHKGHCCCSGCPLNNERPARRRCEHIVSSLAVAGGAGRSPPMAAIGTKMSTRIRTKRGWRSIKAG